MRNILPSLLALSLATAPFGFAQAPQDQSAAQAPTQQYKHQRHPHDPARQAEHLGKKLGLSADQTARLQPILADRDARMSTLMSDNSMDRKAKHQQMRSIMTDTDQKLSAILTPAQQEQFSAMKASHRHRHAPEGTMPPQAS